VFRITNVRLSLATYQVLLVGVLLAGLHFGTVAVAQTAASHYLQPRMERAAFQDLCDALDLDPEQRMIFRTLFEDYLEAMAQAADQADAQADTVGRQEILAVMEGRAVLTADQLRDVRLAVLSTYEELCTDRGTQLLDELLQELEMVLMDMQVAKWPDVVRRLRRQVYLHSRQADGNKESYAGDGVDICQLLEQSDDIGVDLTNDRILSQIYFAYESQVDEIIVDAVGRHLLTQIEMEMANIARDYDRLGELEATSISGWDQLYGLNQSVGQQIAEHLRSLGQMGEAEIWLQRLQEANFPWLFEECEPEFVCAWIVRERPENATKADPIINAYRERIRGIRDQMIVMIVRARSDDGIVLHPEMTSGSSSNSDRRGDLHAAYLRLTGSRSVAESQALTQLMGLLDERSHELLQQDIRRRQVGL